MAETPFDPAPAQELGADETPSPTWLPAVGACLALCAGVWGMTGADAAPAMDSKPVAASVKAPPKASVAAPAAPNAAPGKPPGMTQEKLNQLLAARRAKLAAQKGGAKPPVGRAPTRVAPKVPVPTRQPPRPPAPTRAAAPKPPAAPVPRRPNPPPPAPTKNPYE